MPEFAVVIPCYNAVGHLEGALQSVLKQSHAANSIFVVDDASTDHTRAIAETYRAGGLPVSVIRLERNSGPATARNAALARIAEPFVAFLDADDRWEANHCESLLKLLEQYPDVGLAFSLTSNGGHEGARTAVPVPSEKPVRVLEYLLDDSFVPQSGVMARRSCILEAGSYREGARYSEDYDLWLRMAQRHAFITTGEPTCLRTSHSGQASRNAILMYRGAWETRIRFWDSAGHEAGIVSSERFNEICAHAYDRDLAEAWRSRSLGLLRGVLDLAELVPGGLAISRRWRWRAALLWPFWRVAALAWDCLPNRWRRSTRRHAQFGKISTVKRPTGESGEVNV